MKKLIALFAIPAFAVQAQVQIGTSLGAGLYTGEASIAQTPNFRGTQNKTIYNPLDANWSLARPAGALWVSVPVNKHLAFTYRMEALQFDGNLQAGDLGGLVSQNINMRATAFENSLLVEVRPFAYGPLILQGGVARSQGTYRHSTPGETSTIGSFNAIAIPVGLKLELLSSRQHRAGVYGLARYTHSDDLDGLSDPTIKNSDAYYSSGVYYAFSLERYRPKYKAPKGKRSSACFEF